MTQFPPPMLRPKRKRHIITAVLLLVVIIAALIVLWPRIGLELRAGYNRLRHGVTSLHAPTDGDHDGLDDWSDLMLSARRYVATQPIYDADYYAGGYPPTGHGVCADVIWQALSGAGYDFKSLIDGDIAATPSAYPLPNGTPDTNIDFRRVVNLQVYFQRHGITLTTDVTDTATWQPGDIVFYQGHVAVVSDRRNGGGVPFIIHHAGDGAREEDALSARPIIGHYRWTAP